MDEMDDNQLNIIITISSFFAAILLTTGVEEECLNGVCEILNGCLTITKFAWLLSVMATSYIMINKNNNAISHKICLISFIFANIMTLIYTSFIAIYRIIFTSVIQGIISLVCSLILTIIMIILRRLP
jgi:hypothetical protein